MYIQNNPELVTPGTFAELTDVGNTMYIQDNAKMKSLPSFPKMVNFSGTMQIVNNPVLTSLTGFPKLETIGLGIRISNNPLLTSLTGLEGLKQVNQYFQISGNNALTNISAIQGVAISENLEISSNPLLGTCAIASVCSLLRIAPDQISIAANAAGCNTSEEVQEACEAVLPVTLVSFSGKLTAEGSTALVWTTSSETNSDHFVVEHRNTENEQWSAVGKVPARRESSALATYDFLDTRPASGENLYRLKMVDLDNTFAFSKIISVILDKNLTFTAYPNPVSNRVMIRDYEHVKQAAMYNALGMKVVESQKISAEGIDVTRLQQGIYTITLIQFDGSVCTQKLLVIR
jgi:hypothetical protein